MNYGVCRFEVVGDRESWLYGLLVEQQLIVVPSQTGRNGPVTQVHQILHKDCLFEIGTFALECKGERRAVVILGGICNVETGVFVQKSVVALDANFPLL